MIRINCDRCGKQISEYEACKRWSDFKCKRVDLCQTCKNERDKVLLAAEKEFWKKKVKKGAES